MDFKAFECCKTCGTEVMIEALKTIMDQDPQKFRIQVYPSDFFEPKVKVQFSLEYMLFFYCAR